MRFLILLFFLLGIPLHAQSTKVSALDPLTTPASGDRIPIVDVSDTTQAASGSTKYITWANLLQIGSSVQAYDADLATYAGISPSANVQSLLGAANYSAIKTLLSLNNVENTALTTWTGSTALTTLGTVTTGIWQGSVIAPAYLGTGTGISTKFLRGDGTWVTLNAGTGDLLAANNLSDLASAATARTNLGLAIGTNVQAYDADLSTYAGITPSANVQSLLGAADYSAMRTLLGLVIGTNVQAYDADLTTYAGISPSANVQSLLGAADYSAMRTQLSLVIGTNVQAWDAELDTWATKTPPSGTVVGTSDTQTLSAKTVARSATLGTDDTFEGDTITGLNNSGGVTQWDAVYLNGSSAWVIADANGTGTYPARGIATATASTGNATTVITHGTIRNDAWTWTPGGALYLSTTGGGLTQTAPSASGDVVQVVGFALTADVAFINITGEYLTLE